MSYILREGKVFGDSMLIRIKDKAYCYLCQDDVSMLKELMGNPTDFNMLAESFVFINPIMEKASE